MKNICIIFRREFLLYVQSPMTYIVTAIFLSISGTFFTTYLVSTKYSDTSIKGFVNATQILLLLFASLLTMRLVAEERKLGTWELLLTSPVMDSEIIIGKFLGSLVVLTCMLTLTLYYPVLLYIFGDPDLGPIMTSYAGLFFLGSACLAIGIFASSLTSNQIVSFVVALGILFALWFLGVAGTMIPGSLGEAFKYLSLAHHFPDLIRGILDTRGIVYYLSITTLFLYFAIETTQAGRWR